MTPPDDPFVLDVLALGAPAEVLLNGVPIATVRPPPGNPRFAATINPLIRDGRNTLEVIIEPGVHRDFAGALPDVRSDVGVRCRARLARIARGAVVSDTTPRQVLCAVDFEGAGLVRTFPHVLSAEATIASPFPRWRWERAEPSREGARLTREVWEFAAEYRAALARRDLVRENALSALVHEEMCAAFGSDPVRRLDTLNGVLRQFWARIDWDMEPIDPSALEPRLCADGRLVQCVTRDGESPIRSNADADGGRLSVSMFLGRIDGRLRWLR